jgi:hypothetical protein
MVAPADEDKIEGLERWWVGHVGLNPTNPHASRRSAVPSDPQRAGRQIDRRDLETTTSATTAPTQDAMVNGVKAARVRQTIEAVEHDPQIAQSSFRARNRSDTGGHNMATVESFYGTCWGPFATCVPRASCSPQPGGASATVTRD